MSHILGRCRSCVCYTSEGHRILPKVVCASCYSLFREQRAKLVSHISSLNLEIQDGTDVPEPTLVFDFGSFLWGQLHYQCCVPNQCGHCQSKAKTNHFAVWVWEQHTFVKTRLCKGFEREPYYSKTFSHTGDHTILSLSPNYFPLWFAFGTHKLLHLLEERKRKVPWMANI